LENDWRYSSWEEIKLRRCLLTVQTWEYFICDTLREMCQLRGRPLSSTKDVAKL
jgi:hypothetical protein